MIGALKGTIYSKSQNSLILFVMGVGYQIFVTNRFFSKAIVNAETFLYIHSHIRDDAFDLFGFPTNEELNLFELLLTVSGIGPKTALFIVDRGVSETTSAVQKSDVDFFTAIPRLGRKNAQKIIIELKSKLGSLTDLDLSGAQTSETGEILDALSSLGFAKQDILSVIKTLPPEADSTEEKIRYCLKQLGGRS